MGESAWKVLRSHIPYSPCRQDISEPTHHVIQQVFTNVCENHQKFPLIIPKSYTYSAVPRSTLCTGSQKIKWFS